MCTWQHSRIFVFTIAQWTGVHRFFLGERRSSTAHRHRSASKTADRAVVARRATRHRAVGLSMTVVVSCRCVIAGNTRHAAVFVDFFLACLSCVGFTDNILHSFGPFSRATTTTTTTVASADKLIIRCTLSNIYIYLKEKHRGKEKEHGRKVS